MRRLLGTTLATLTLLAGSLLAGPLVAAGPATAAGAQIGRTIWLADNAGLWGGTAYLLGTDRRIYLAANTYSWRNRLVQHASSGNQVFENGRTIQLAAGWYHWNCVIQPEGGSSLAYLSRCSLRGDGSTGAAWTPYQRVQFWGSERLAPANIWGDDFTWTSTLT